MGIQTNYLKLIKPMAGSVGWGAAINNNWDTIDREYAKLNNNLAVIQSRMTDIGTFGFLSYVDGDAVVDVDYIEPVTCIIRVGEDFYQVTKDNLKNYGDSAEPYYYWLLDENKKTKTLPNEALLSTYGMAYLGTEKSRADGSKYFVQDANEYRDDYYNNDDDTQRQFNSLADFTAFYLHIPHYCMGAPTGVEDLKSVSCVYIYGLELYFDGILIKTSRLIDNKYTTLLSKFKQVLGGYYVPRSTTDRPNTIIFEKSSASSSTQYEEIFIPRSVANSTETIYSFSKTHKDTTTIRIPTNVKMALVSDTGYITYSQNIANVNFFTRDGETRNPVIMEHELQYTEGGWEIVVEAQNLPMGDTFFASWVMLAPDITQLQE